MRPTPLFVVTSIAALALSVTASLHASEEAKVTPPPVPANLEVGADYKAYLEGHAYGTQNYICLPSATGVAWTLFGPQATLFNADLGQIITHFISPNPEENGTLRATWQHSRDTSSVWAFATPATTSTDPNYVAPGAIPWLLLRVVGKQEGPDGGDKLTETAFIHRVNTAGGIAPATGCAATTDVGKRAFVPYETDYIFYRLRD